MPSGTPQKKGELNMRLNQHQNKKEGLRTGKFQALLGRKSEEDLTNLCKGRENYNTLLVGVGR